MLKVDYIVNKVFTSRTYILSEENQESVWLVDCGDVEKIEKPIAGVLLTHSHSDHIYGLNRMLERNPSATVCTNAFGLRALSDPRLNISRYHLEYGDFILASIGSVKVLGEGDAFDILGHKVEIIKSPGHDESCLCYKIGDAFFTGDSYIPGVKVTASFPHSDRLKAIESEKRIKEMSAGCTIYPGHETNGL